MKDKKFQLFRGSILPFLAIALVVTAVFESALANQEFDASMFRPHNISTPLVIFDTDMGPDIDDVLALAMLHTYQNQGKIELAAVTVSRNSYAGAIFSDVINTFYGRPDIPIGIYEGETFWQGNDNALYPILASNYPYDIEQTLPKGVDIQRRVLARAAQEGRRVIMIQVGFSGNISDLLDSPADQISSKTGKDLIKENVDFLSIMATRRNSNKPEFNVEKDLVSAKNLFAKWPIKMIITGGATGDNILYPYSSIKNDFNYVSSHPVKAAYEYTDLSWHQDQPPFYNMRSWDLLSVLEAIEPEKDYLKRSGPGRLTLNDTGVSSFVKGSGKHYLLTSSYSLSETEKRTIVARLIELVTAKPIPRSDGYLYQQPNDGEYWWIKNNTRRWLYRHCARKHQDAGVVAKIIQYSELVKLPRDDGPCPAVEAPTPTPTPTPPHGVPDLSSLNNPAGLHNFHDYENASSSQINALGSGKYGAFVNNDFTTVGPVPFNGTSPQGQFRVICTPSHFSYDDPIVFPKQPGKAHLHMFWGNTKADANTEALTGSANDLLERGGSTCQGGALNRSAYWVPAMFSGGAGAGRKIVMPKAITLYYKSYRPWEAQPLPQGIQLLVGNINPGGKPNVSFSPTHRLHWGCYNPSRGSAVNLSGTIPGTNGTSQCPNGWDIQATITFPQCIAMNGGKPRLTHPDFVSHTKLEANNNLKCPASHPYRVPQISYLIRWANPDHLSESSWRLSSDRDFEKPTGQVPFPGGSLHGDWLGGWHDGTIQAWMDGCFRTSKGPGQRAHNCSLGQTGSNGTSRLLNRIRGTGMRGGLMEYTLGPQLLDDPEPFHVKHAH